MPDYDFSHSFIRWTSTRVQHTPRMQLAAACRVIRDGETRDYFLSEPCVAEAMYQPHDLVHRPPCEFMMIMSSKGEFAFAKLYADLARNQSESHQTGGVMSTHDGLGAKVVDLACHLTPVADARPLHGYDQVRQAILSGQRLNARSLLVSADGEGQVILDYPLKTVNIANDRQAWQIDAGPILLPNLGAAQPWSVAGLRPGYLVCNAPDWVEWTCRAVLPSDEREPGSHFGAPQRHAAHTELLALPD